MMLLYRRLRLKIDPDVKRAYVMVLCYFMCYQQKAESGGKRLGKLELKFSVNIELNKHARVKTFKEVARTVSQKKDSNSSNDEPPLLQPSPSTTNVKAEIHESFLRTPVGK
ncbi:hypothetical protein GCK32_005720 [Trichostrongylus colubriformis]|uniref:Uncharacterized protein n=1 Tax=Trichostrongylus colubriformis TaxID=6319 RepID=A0AAN8IEG2_TRICO